MKDQAFYAFIALVALVPLYWISIATFVLEYNRALANEDRDKALKIWSANPIDTLDVIKALWATSITNKNQKAFVVSALFSRILFIILLVGFVAFFALGI